MHEADRLLARRQVKDQPSRGTKTSAVLTGTREEQGKSWDSGVGRKEGQDHEAWPEALGMGGDNSTTIQKATGLCQ